MSLKIYNTLSGEKEEFKPIKPNKVGMYVCGVTVYDECHIGHARAAVVFDIIYRYLEHRGYKVTYIRNFTDVDDKIIKKALETKSSCEEVSKKYIDSYHQAMKSLGVHSPTHEPLATKHIPEMLTLIQTIEKNGYAYAVDGDVVYSVRKLKNYGQLSHKKINELESGARVEVNEKKKDPLDFVLWKASKPDEPKWKSPWGEGRPGWHIECSAMSMKHLGEQFDIHGGGRDLIFPHHENEIAQSEAVSGKLLARYWIHNGFVNINAEKMGKSLGNIKTVPAILEKWSPEAVRLFLLSSHYRSPVNFTETTLDESETAIQRFYETIKRLQEAPSGKESLPAWNLLTKFEEAMSDDFNTAQVVGTIYDGIRQLNNWLDQNQSVEKKSRKNLLDDLKKVGTVLGIFHQEPDAYLKSRKERHLSGTELSADQIEAKIKERLEARKSKNFKQADSIRDTLASQGILLKDNPDGTTSWSVK